MKSKASVRQGMRIVCAIVALLGQVEAAQAQPAWRGDVSGGALAEAWDHNEGTESLVGAFAGLDRRLWGSIAVRAEIVGVRVQQDGADAWIRGFTVGTRVRWPQSTLIPFIDVAVGLSDATRRVPPRGTTFNYLALAGGGVEWPLDTLVMSVTGRWLHASNNGREGRHLNPDIQAVGVLVGVGWEF